MKKKIAAITLFLIVTNVNAQHHILGGMLGYQNQSGNWLKVGGYYQRVTSSDFSLKLHGSANFIKSENAWKTVPEIGVTVYPNANKLIAPLGQIEATPYTLTPKVGLSILQLLELNIGYGFSYRTSSYIKKIEGVNFSLTFQIPLNYKMR